MDIPVWEWMEKVEIKWNNGEKIKKRSSPKEVKIGEKWRWTFGHDKVSLLLYEQVRIEKIHIVLESEKMKE